MCMYVCNPLVVVAIMRIKKPALSGSDNRSLLVTSASAQHGSSSRLPGEPGLKISSSRCSNAVVCSEWKPLKIWGIATPDSF